MLLLVVVKNVYENEAKVLTKKHKHASIKTSF